MKRNYLFLLPLILLACSSGEDGATNYTGIIDANTVRVSAETQGRITQLAFDEGDQVDSGKALITVEAVKLGFQLSAQEAGIDELNDSFEAAKRELDAATLQRDNLRQRYERLSALLKTNAVTQQQVDDIKTQLDASNQKLDGARKSLDAIQSRKRQMESNIGATKDQLAKSRVTAPVSGTVLVRYVETGELVSPGIPVCEIADLRNVWTKIYISETDLPSMYLGQQVQVYIDGKDNKPLAGVISWISSESEFTANTYLTEETRTTLVYAAKVRIDNSEGILKIGMPVSVVVKGGK